MFFTHVKPKCRNNPTAAVSADPLGAEMELNFDKKLSASQKKKLDQKMRREQHVTQAIEKVMASMHAEQNKSRITLPKDGAKLVEIEIEVSDKILNQLKNRDTAEFVGLLHERKTEVKTSTLNAEKRKELERAKTTEIESWLKYEVVAAASRQGLDAKALMRMRWVITARSSGALKARLVLLGFQDPRLGHLKTASPTVSRRGRQCFLALAASFGWQVKKGDVKAAFLQGDNEAAGENLSDAPVLNDPIYAEPCRELKDALGLEHWQCVELRKAIYGLCNAPRAWWLRLSKDLLVLGWAILTLEACFWVLRNQFGELVGMLVGHVDDVMLAVAPDNEQATKAEKKVRELYDWGSWESGDFVQTGTRIRQERDPRLKTWGEIRLDMKDYVDTIKPVQVPASLRRSPSAPLTKTLATAFRSGLCQLLWVAEQQQPLLAAPVSLLLGHSSSSTVSCLLELNKLIKLAHEWSEIPLIFHRHSSLAVVTFSDAAWKVRRDMSSQGGRLVLLMNREALTGAISPATLLSWASKKLSRKVRSSAAAEAQEATDAEEEGLYTRLVLAEVVYGNLDLKNWTESARLVPSALVLDCKCLYDALSRSESTALGLADRRSALEAYALKENMAHTFTSLRWVHSFAQLADMLTKHSAESRAAYLEFVKRRCYWRLVHDSRFISAKRRMKAGLDILDVVRGPVDDKDVVEVKVRGNDELKEDEFDVEIAAAASTMGVDEFDCWPLLEACLQDELAELAPSQLEEELLPEIERNDRNPKAAALLRMAA